MMTATQVIIKVCLASASLFCSFSLTLPFVYLNSYFLSLFQWFSTYGSRPKLGREGLAEGREGSAGGKGKIREMSGNFGGNP